MSHEEPPRGRLARLFEAAGRRGVPLRTILVTVGVVAAACLTGQLIYRLRDIVLLMLVAGFTAMLLSPGRGQSAAAGPAPGPGAGRSSRCGPRWPSPAWPRRSGCRW